MRRTSLAATVWALACTNPEPSALGSGQTGVGPDTTAPTDPANSDTTSTADDVDAGSTANATTSSGTDATSSSDSGSADVGAIPGDVVDGESTTITGRGFGDKSSAPPLVFDDFEGRRRGSGVELQPADVGEWGSGEWAFAVTHAEGAARKGTGSALHRFRPPDVWNASLYVDPPATSTFYLDFWIRIDPLDVESRNFKSWRVYDTAGVERGNDVYYCLGDGPGGVGLDPEPWAWKEGFYTPGQWMHYQVVARYGGTESIFVQSRDATVDIDATGFDNDAEIAGIRIGHYWGMDASDGCGPNSGADIYTDLVYVDDELARVELGDAPEYGDCSHRAIQIPISWSDSEIVYTANTQGFEPGVTAHEFVIDADNRVVQSRAVTIGG